MRVMVVEDSPDLATLFTIWLTQAAIEVQPVTSDFSRLLAPGAWDGIDAAVVDLNLASEMHGDDILRHLLENEPQVRRVICSAVSVPDHSTLALAHQVLLKPVDPSEFLAAVRG